MAALRRVHTKMTKIGIAAKLSMTLTLGYTDVLTDFLVAKSYYDVKEFNTAYATAGLAVFAIAGQALCTFLKYRKNRERFGCTLAALLGLSPLVEGWSVWTGKDDPDLLLTNPQMYAGMKALEIAFESIPKSIVQVNGLLKQDLGDIQAIQIIGVISSIVAGALIMTDGNFGIILSKYLESPANPYYGWISKVGGLEKRRQMFGMFLFNACYFSQFVFAMKFCTVCAYMGRKGELFGFSSLGNVSTFNSYVAPFIFWAFWYMLASAVLMLVTAVTCELGPEIFAGTMVWRLLTNGGIVYLALGELEKEEHFLSLTTGMAGYGVSLGLAALGLVMFFRNCDSTFDRSLFWRPKRGKQLVRECWSDKNIWHKDVATKDDEIWGWVEFIHPTYFPFDLVTLWLCEKLVEKYEDKNMEKPERMNKKNEGKFIKRIAKIYAWKGTDGEEVDKALEKLFERSGADLEEGLDWQLSFIPSKKNTK
ncbi:hypothetical protein TL16_g05789 [Triparma laevis f. inornata]|uniref:Uncharacterized protein n=1 Tax=Triparma laevis f. inornata TaxID=1714386 RepID=A0A9W7AL93_9STRA|nr:hypothetical protein TL16_g05789 [Triparma laevis f. inornata]